MQSVHFRSIDECLDFLAEDERMITEQLRALVHDSIPQVREKLAYNVPYFYRRANICFIWPGSIAWGQKQNPGVRLGFTQGHLLDDEICYLDRGNRKQVYWRDFFHLQDLDHELIMALLSEAAELDEHLWLEKHQRQK